MFACNAELIMCMCTSMLAGSLVTGQYILMRIHHGVADMPMYLCSVAWYYTNCIAFCYLCNSDNCIDSLQTSLGNHHLHGLSVVIEYSIYGMSYISSLFINYQLA